MVTGLTVNGALTLSIGELTADWTRTRAWTDSDGLGSELQVVTTKNKVNMVTQIST